MNTHLPANKTLPLPDLLAERDMLIRHDLESELQWEPSIDDRKIGVLVHQGIVTLTGEVPSLHARSAVEAIACRIEGVEAIANELVVRDAAADGRSDIDLANAVRDVLRANIATRWSPIKAIVSGAVVTLTGDANWMVQGALAELLAREVPGVKDVVNRVGLKSHRDEGEWS